MQDIMARKRQRVDGQHVHVGLERDNGRAAGAEPGDDAGARDLVVEPNPWALYHPKICFFKIKLK